MAKSLFSRSHQSTIPGSSQRVPTADDFYARRTVLTVLTGLGSAAIGVLLIGLLMRVGTRAATAGTRRIRSQWAVPMTR